jgi:hypothetical protein
VTALRTALWVAFGITATGALALLLPRARDSIQLPVPAADVTSSHFVDPPGPAARERVAQPDLAPDIAHIATPAGDLVPARPAPNDDTYALLVGILRDSGHADQTEEAERAHADFKGQPDDPRWARDAEQRLRQFLESSASRSLQLTSVACSSAGCEVQGQVFDPGELKRQLQPGVPHPIAEVRPLGPGLSLKVALRGAGMDPVPFYLWYVREAADTP